MNSIKEQFPYEIIPIFPLPIYKTNIVREFTKEEQDELDVIISEQMAEVVASTAFYGKGLQRLTTKHISIDRYLLNRKIFLSIHSFIQHHLKEFVTNILRIDTTKHTFPGPRITQSWLNNYKHKHYESPHAHPNSIISGSLYINCLELPGNETDGIVFVPTSHHLLDELRIEHKYAQDTIFSDKPYHVSVVKGDLILFPSSAMHIVDPNVTLDQTRISLSFNSC